MENIQAVVGQLISVRLKESANGDLETCQRVNGKRTLLSFGYSDHGSAARAGDVWAVTLTKKTERNRFHYVRLQEIISAVDGLEEVISSTPLYYVDGTRRAESICAQAEREHGPNSVHAVLAYIEAMGLIISPDFYLRLRAKALGAFGVCESALRSDEYADHLDQVALWLERNRMHDEAIRCYQTVLSAQEEAKVQISETRLQEIRFYLGTMKASANEWSDAIEFFKLVGNRDGDIEVAKCLVHRGRLAEACELYQNILDKAQFLDHDRL
jgi:tetratricopeptide (TPR) repeat protein